MHWREPPKETEKTFRDASLTQGDHVGGFLGGGLAAGSYEPLFDLLLIPFIITFRLIILPARLCLFLIRRVRHHPATSV